jgi:hypothetical protein
LAGEGRPSVVIDDGRDEKGEAGEPDGASTGVEAVVNAEGWVVCAWATDITVPVDKIRRRDRFKRRANIMGQQIDD